MDADQKIGWECSGCGSKVFLSYDKNNRFCLSFPGAKDARGDGGVPTNLDCEAKPPQPPELCCDRRAAPCDACKALVDAAGERSSVMLSTPSGDRALLQGDSLVLPVDFTLAMRILDGAGEANGRTAVPVCDVPDWQSHYVHLSGRRWFIHINRFSTRGSCIVVGGWDSNF